MKRIVLMLFIGVLLTACGASEPETAVTIPNETAEPETAVIEEDIDPELASETDETVAIAGFPATTVEEASIVRDRDWTKGTDDPLVSIIEYGDFQ